MDSSISVLECYLSLSRQSLATAEREEGGGEKVGTRTVASGKEEVEVERVKEQRMTQLRERRGRRLFAKRSEV